jgi:polyhydroxyalkanoate synthesis repressor PhaR
MAEKVLLKKYANRRLYNTEKSSYVNLVEVGDLIREGREVQIIDAKTEEDVTAFILTQIIVEEAKKKNSLLPVSLLHLFIQFGENVLGEFFDQYLELSIRNYIAFKKTFDDQFRKWLEKGLDFSELTQKSMTPFPSNPFLDFFQGMSANPNPKDS